MSTDKKGNGKQQQKEKKAKVPAKKASDFGTPQEWYAYRREQIAAKAERTIARIDAAEKRVLAKGDPKEQLRQKIARLQAKLAELDA